MNNLNSLQIKPMLATASDPFNDKKYLFEVKWDGYRATAYLTNQTRLLSRNLKDFTKHYPNLADLYKKIKAPGVVLDGEIITLEKGKPSFQSLQNRTQKPSIFVAFDILYHNGKGVMDLPLEERKHLLEEVITEADNIIISQYILEDGKKLFQSCIEQGLEGIVAKELGSLYIPDKRVSFWKKIKGIKEGDFIIIGYLPSKKSIIKSLALASFEGNMLNFRGLVGTGLSAKVKNMLIELFREIPVAKGPFTNKIPELQNCIYILPHFLCTIEYLEITKEGRLRHPSFKGIRSDKFANDIIEEERDD